MRGRRAVLVALTLALALAVGGLGGLAGASTADKQTPLSKKAFIRAGDSICKQTNQLIVQAAQSAFGSLKANEKPTAAQLQSFVDTAGPATQQEIDSLRALPAPKADTKKLKTIFDLVQKGTHALLADPNLLLGSKSPAALVKARKQAKAYGFKICGSGSA